MGKRQSRYEEVVVWVVATGVQKPAKRTPDTPIETPAAEGNTNIWQRLGLWFHNRLISPDTATPCSYDAWVYTDLELPDSDHSAHIDQTNAPAFDLFKLAMRGRIIVNRENYEEYLATFVRGEKAGLHSAPRGNPRLAMN